MANDNELMKCYVVFGGRQIAKVPYQRNASRSCPRTCQVITKHYEIQTHTSRYLFYGS